MTTPFRMAAAAPLRARAVRAPLTVLIAVLALLCGHLAYAQQAAQPAIAAAAQSFNHDIRVGH